MIMFRAILWIAFPNNAQLLSRDRRERLAALAAETIDLQKVTVAISPINTLIITPITNIHVLATILFALFSRDEALVPGTMKHTSILEKK
jgi:hypothetical protein